jgi:hypothetical protein
MDEIAIEPPIVVEPINQTPALFDLAGWLHGQFPCAIAPIEWLSEPSRLPVIDW